MSKVHSLFKGLSESKSKIDKENNVDLVKALKAYGKLDPDCLVVSTTNSEEVVKKLWVDATKGNYQALRIMLEYEILRDEQEVRDLSTYAGLALKALRGIQSGKNFVYFVLCPYNATAYSEDEYVVKVGVSVDYEQRMKDLQVSNPYELRLLGLTKGGFRLETQIKKDLQLWRVRGEWFKYNEFVREYVEIRIGKRDGSIKDTTIMRTIDCLNEAEYKGLYGRKKRYKHHEITRKS